jgi:hypothetical protein
MFNEAANKTEAVPSSKATSLKGTLAATPQAVLSPELEVAITNNIGLAISSMAWPIAAIIIAAKFKKEISAFLARIRNFKGLGIEASLDEYIQASLTQPVTDVAQLETSTEKAGLMSAVEEILRAWGEVEAAINGHLSLSTNTVTRVSSQTKIARLRSELSLPVGLLSRIQELYDIRRRVGRNPDAALSGESIALYVENARQAVNDLLSHRPVN